jgi:hypothetical protein
MIFDLCMILFVAIVAIKNINFEHRLTVLEERGSKL